MTEFTPGPWELIIDDTGDKWSGWPLSIDTINEPDKCVVHTGGMWPYDWGTATSQNEALANARLIASAPDLLMALEEIVAFLETASDYEATHPFEYRRPLNARVAIAKARGEPATMEDST